MYQEYFGLAKRPCEPVARGEAVFVAERHTRIIAALKTALRAPDAIAVLTGPVGVGKTTVAAHAIGQIATDMVVLSLGRVRLTPDQLPERLLAELGYTARDASRTEQLSNLQEHLAEQSKNGARVCILVEDAQRIGTEALAELEALTAADSGGTMGANILLMGRPDIRGLLDDPELTNLRQRTRAQQELEPLSAEDVEAYLEHRLNVAGGRSHTILAEGVAAMLHKCSGGIPRLVDNLCETALEVAAANKLLKLVPLLVKRVAVSDFGIDLGDTDNPQPVDSKSDERSPFPTVEGIQADADEEREPFETTGLSAGPSKPGADYVPFRERMRAKMREAGVVDSRPADMAAWDAADSDPTIPGPADSEPENCPDPMQEHGAHLPSEPIQPVSEFAADNGDTSAWVSPAQESVVAAREEIFGFDTAASAFAAAEAPMESDIKAEPTEGAGSLEPERPVGEQESPLSVSRFTEFSSPEDDDSPPAIESKSPPVVFEMPVVESRPTLEETISSMPEAEPPLIESESAPKVFEASVLESARALRESESPVPEPELPVTEVKSPPVLPEPPVLQPEPMAIESKSALPESELAVPEPPVLRTVVEPTPAGSDADQPAEPATDWAQAGVPIADDCAEKQDDTETPQADETPVPVKPGDVVDVSKAMPLAPPAATSTSQPEPKAADEPPSWSESDIPTLELLTKPVPAEPKSAAPPTPSPNVPVAGESDWSEADIPTLEPLSTPGNPDTAEAASAAGSKNDTQFVEEDIPTLQPLTAPSVAKTRESGAPKPESTAEPEKASFMAEADTGVSSNADKPDTDRKERVTTPAERSPTDHFEKLLAPVNEAEPPAPVEPEPPTAKNSDGYAQADHVDKLLVDTAPDAGPKVASKPAPEPVPEPLADDEEYLEALASQLSSARSLEELDDELSETLFGNAELNELGAKLAAKGAQLNPDLEHPEDTDRLDPTGHFELTLEEREAIVGLFEEGEEERSKAAEAAEAEAQKVKPEPEPNPEPTPEQEKQSAGGGTGFLSRFKRPFTS